MFLSDYRHVRTRIYFTSESHMHSLLNVLRYSHLGNGSSNTGPSATSSRSNSLSRGVSGIDGPATSAAAAAAAAAAAVGGGSGGSSSSGGGGVGSAWAVVAPANAAPASAVADVPTLAAAVCESGCAGSDGQAVGGGAASVGVLVSAPSAVNLPPLARAGSVTKDCATAAAAAPAASITSAFTATGIAAGGSASGSSGGGGGGAGGGSLSGGGAGAHAVTPGAPQRKCLLSEEAYDMLRDTPELDYLTHLVIRMYENKAVPADHPGRDYSTGHVGTSSVCTSHGIEFRLL